MKSRMSSKLSSTKKVPVIDLGHLGLGQEPGQEEWQRVTRELYNALTEFGCSYLANHGVPDDQWRLLYDSTIAFFNLEQGKKDRYAFDADKLSGYIGMGSESYSGSTRELCEGLLARRTEQLPDEPEIPSLKPAAESFLKSCKELSERIMAALSLSLGKDPEHLLSIHKERGTDKNITTLRFNHYPPVPSTIPEGTFRFGAHRDFGTITFIFQDDCGGLQVQDSEGSWFDVTPVPGTIFLLAGEFLQFHSGEKFLAPTHKVLIPAGEEARGTARVSILYFVAPDNHIPMRPPGNPSTDTPMTVQEYITSSIKNAQK
ncbi:2-oxoglutarate-Fe(II) type oxidoreductase ppzD-like [Homarus americanus]|uniref:2-oxoglutarate-dependent dioxygenase htyE-like 2 n=1 Tax=Homarus americanus TaxID=6706 RepID=A0A8J5JYT4_HOMAM|nr:2-oxoglutarate-Fe(II) type oxidoreductase ppzD-like [Homarus americanus]XP_042225737.1 2-oxoglutarate-Fe(II) type oxidoreductase ppzD-like [Homarus americanus]XP_042225738.1 2-oxoglutarate-Fe(II) type oxidoreductase ppzD-like [Homarus americanus]XP_042225739.1 2-oxoglutarate-Fe(II) type oxidoreductase ppzD-like [Homarus americanus]KAG7167117.1 2-oxoglutarate-dependent dioxygenase htyE-like 2 [Homarus americanus]